jgi:hypothetical protein
MTATPLVLFNATLSDVSAAGSAPDYDRAAIPGASKWAGSERVFLHEPEIGRVTSGSESDVLSHRGLIVDPALTVTWVPGDIVTYARDATPSTTETGTVRGVIIAGSADSGYTVRLVLEDA